MKEETIDNFLNIIFAKKSTARLLLVIMIIGLILRIIAAINIGMFADDTHFAVHAMNFFYSGKLETYDQSSSLWYLLTDIFYKILGTTQFASRFASVLFGTMSILAIFLLSKEFFDEKISLISSFLLAISPFAIKNMMAEMDTMAVFFIIFGMYFFISALKKDKTSLFAVSGIIMGLGIITKLYVFFFLPPLIIYAFYYNWKKTSRIFTKRIIKKLIVFMIIAGIFFMPAVIHNYLLYQEKGILDFQFTRVFHYGEDKAAQFYSWDAGWKAKPDYLGFFTGNSKQLPWSKMPSSLYALTYILYNDFIVFILGVLGLIFIFRKNRNYFWFFILSFIIPFFYLASIILLSKHYLFVLILLIPPAAYSIDKILEKIQNKIKIRRRYIFLILLVLSLIILGYQAPYISNHFYGKSAIAQMMSYKQANIEDNSLVVVDSRIYRGTLTWIFNDKHYVESAYFPSLLQEQQNLSGRITMPVYYIECIKDDCGWGTIASQPDFNNSMEEITSYFKNNSQEKATIGNIEQDKFYFPFSDKREDYYKVYKTGMNLVPQTLSMADSTHTLFMYPLNYNGVSFDNFSRDSLLYKMARLIQYLAVLLAFLSIIALLYLIINIKEEK